MGIDLRSVFLILRRRWWLFVIVPLLGAFLGYVVADRQPRMYAATASMMVTSQARPEGSPHEYQDVQLAQALAPIYLDMVLKDPILEPVVVEHSPLISVDELRASTTVGLSSGTLLSVTVSSDNPSFAARLASDIATQTAIYSTEMPVIGGIVNVTDFASIPLSPYAPRVPAYVVLGGALGVLAASALAATERFDSRHRSRRPPQNLRPLAVVPRVPRKMKFGVDPFASLDPRSRAAGSVRTLRAAILSADGDRHAGTGRGLAVGFFSPRRATGQTSLVAALARTMANSGISVVVVDLNLTHPGIGRCLGIEGEHGMVELLKSPNGSWKDFAYQVSPHLEVILSGAMRMSGTDALANPRLPEVIRQIAAETDVVLVDAPPSGLSSEFALVGRAVDIAIVVAREGRTLRRDLSALIDDLDHANVDILGLVTTFGPRGGARPLEYYGASSRVRTLGMGIGTRRPISVDKELAAEKRQLA